MIDFTLSATEQELLNVMRIHGRLAREHARYYDEHEEVHPPDLLPGADDLPPLPELTVGEGGEECGAAVRAMLAAAARTWGDYAVMPRRDKGGLGNAALSAAGTPEQHARWGHLTLAMANTEPGCGSDSSAIRTTALRDGDGWVLDGEKIFVTSGCRADGVVVWATLDRQAGRAGIKAFLVPKDTPGLVVVGKEKKLGIRADDTATCVLEQCRIPLDHLLGGDATIRAAGSGSYRKVLQTFNMTRPAVGALGLGIAQAALEFTREQLLAAGIVLDNGDPCASSPPTATAHELMRLETLHEAAMLTVLHAAWLADRGQPNNLEASIAKSKAGSAARRITQGCIKLLGPMAVSREHLLEKWFRDARITDLYEGTGQIQSLIIARAILGYSREELS